jgi:hypothetical protein
MTSVLQFRLRTLLIVVAVLAVKLAVADDPPAIDVYFLGSRQYDEHIGTLKLNFEDARKRLTEFRNAHVAPEKRFFGRHYLVIGDDYVFSHPPQKDEIALQGWYVNGTTGEVCWIDWADIPKRCRTRWPRGAIPFTDAIKLGYKSGKSVSGE